jgi:hypothetical protein
MSRISIPKPRVDYLSEDHITLYQHCQLDADWASRRILELETKLQAAEAKGAITMTLDELAELERTLAFQQAHIVIRSELKVDREDDYATCWYDVNSAQAGYEPLIELRYLELRGLLERHPDDPNLVRIKE